jgi:hypothetical protein
MEKEVGTLICDLSEQGIKLSVNQGNLKVDAPKGRVTPDVLRVLKDRKPEIIKELKGVDGEFQFGKTASLYRGAKLPNRIHLDEAIHLYLERGWIQIYSTYLESNIYLVRDDAIRVPDPSIPKYTQAEIQSLKDLTLDELKTLHEAKVLFKGKIIS